MHVPPGTPRRAHEPTPGFFYTPDCDTAPVLLPPGGAVEETYGAPAPLDGAFSGHRCPGFDGGGDCPPLLARGERRLYEIYRATLEGDRLRTGCLAIWPLDRRDPDGRGQQCTSADAAGLPIAPLLFTAEEVAAGEIAHAIRFVLPPDLIRRRSYVAPATHGADTRGPAAAPPYGLRLRADYPLARLVPAAQVVARALERHGMLLADSGQIALTAQRDLLGEVKGPMWASTATPWGRWGHRLRGRRPPSRCRRRTTADVRPSAMERGTAPCRRGTHAHRMHVGLCGGARRHLGL